MLPLLIWLVGGLALGLLTARRFVAALGESAPALLLCLALYGPLYWLVMLYWAVRELRYDRRAGR